MPEEDRDRYDHKLNYVSGQNLPRLPRHSSGLGRIA